MPEPKRFLLPLIILTSAALSAQTAAGSIQATGTVTLNVNPDQVQLSLSVITTASTASQAAQQNAAQTNALITALNQVLGQAGNIQTVGYTLYPQYGNSANPSIVGYTVSNSLQVTTTVLSLAGSLIDAANQAGASNIGGLSFGLQNPDPTVQQALAAAAKQALAHAGAIASGLGAKAGAVISAQQNASVTPLPGSATPVAAASTPVLTGTVGVSATVTVTTALSQ
ncbi:MAG: SIMPL domain-containing protein [Bryobacteraceae bacterium]